MSFLLPKRVTETIEQFVECHSSEIDRMLYSTKLESFCSIIADVETHLQKQCITLPEKIFDIKETENSLLIEVTVYSDQQVFLHFNVKDRPSRRILVNQKIGTIVILDRSLVQFKRNR